MRLESVRATRARKSRSSSGVSILRAGKAAASGNAFMEMVTDKCTRMTFLLAETRTWKGGLSTMQHASH